MESVITKIINATVLSAIIGALLGAFATHFIGAYFEKRKKKRIAKENLVGELSAIAHKCIAALMELHAERIFDSQKESGIETRKCLAKITNIAGEALQLNIRLYQNFTDRKLRASYTKFFNRFDETRKWFSRDSCPSSTETADLCYFWILDQAEKTVRYASNEAGISLRDPSRIVFIRFGKVTPQDMFELSFDDRPPPWKFYIRYDFTKKVDDSLLKKETERITRKIASMRCQKHALAVHIVVRGRNFSECTWEISGCCKEFINSAMKRIAVEGKIEVVLPEDRASENL